MTTIEYFRTDRLYRFLWLKSVNDINLSVHCANCLIGSYNPNFGSMKREVGRVVLDDARAYYLCGVSADRKWSHNLHVAFTFCEGSSFTIEDEFCQMLVTNARRLDISTKYIDWSLPQAKVAAFNTCRNWQFANMLAKGLMANYEPAKDLQYRNNAFLTLF